MYRIYVIYFIALYCEESYAQLKLRNPKSTNVECVCLESPCVVHFLLYKNDNNMLKLFFNLFRRGMFLYKAVFCNQVSKVCRVVVLFSNMILHWFRSIKGVSIKLPTISIFSDNVNSTIKCKINKTFYCNLE